MEKIATKIEMYKNQIKNLPAPKVHNPLTIKNPMEISHKIKPILLAQPILVSKNEIHNSNHSVSNHQKPSDKKKNINTIHLYPGKQLMQKDIKIYIKPNELNVPLFLTPKQYNCTNLKPSLPLNRLPNTPKELVSSGKNIMGNEQLSLNNHMKINNNLKISLNSKKVVTGNSKQDLKISSHKNIFEKINLYKNSKINVNKCILHFKSLSNGQMNNESDQNKEKVGSKKKTQIHKIINSAFGSRIENESHGIQNFMSSKSSPSSIYSSRKNLMEEASSKNLVQHSNLSNLKNDTPLSTNLGNDKMEYLSNTPPRTSVVSEIEKKIDNKFDNPPPLKIHKFEMLRQKLINYIKECTFK